ncbi:unnamed protein product [Plasmodium vivax]|uniref:(malaria parasite P. vivax) hypothetical protein n=1 Tax=Plasmodium vivax TaxID=5855 RepID=A0A8S4HK85_PLAVI|nr:unnamed protein product [Plasmodium vivax]
MDDNYDTTDELPSVRYYKRIDNKFFDQGNEEECNSLDEQFDISDPYLLCMRLTGKLKRYDDLEIPDHLEEYKCKYLNLWVYDRLSKLEEDTNITTKSFILNLWKQSKIFNVCDSSQFVSYINKFDAIKAKRLFDYAFNYNTLHFLCGNINYKCTKKMSQYINTSKDLIRDIIAECQGDDNLKHYCVAYRDIKQIYSDKDLLSLECRNVEDVRTEPLDARPERPKDHAASRGDGEGPRGDIVGLGVKPVRALDDNALHTGKVKGAGDELPDPTYADEVDTDNPTRHSSQRTVDGATVYSLEDPDVSPPPNTPKTTTIALPALSALSLGFMLFKFTAIGPRVRSLFGNRRINGMNSNQNITRELLEDAYRFNDNPDMAQGYIGYHAT